MNLRIHIASFDASKTAIYLASVDEVAKILCVVLFQSIAPLFKMNCGTPRTARISIPPIEPNLAERARISAINLDDYQLDPLTPPPSPSSPFTMAAYQRMIAETDPTQRKDALTGTGQNLVPVP
ncbi:hypothetical protein Tco_0089282 [Tanacetum coccineum]